MRVACLGGGPAGLDFAISMKLREPAPEVVVFKRDRTVGTFGWGMKLSDETPSNPVRNEGTIVKKTGMNGESAQPSLIKGNPQERCIETDEI